MTDRPSYFLKLDRAQVHLDVLKGEIEAFADSHPYTVAKRRERKKEIWRLNFTSGLPTDISLVGADFVHNVRSALDHMTAALVPSARKDKTRFPILWAGVWEPYVEGEDEKTSEGRARWETIVKKMKPEAVAILKEVQPYAGYETADGHVHLLSSLNRLWNTDKHTRLPFIIGGLVGSTVTFTMSDGSVNTYVDTDPRGLSDNAKLTGPTGVVDVKIKGTMEVAVRVALPDGVIPMLHHFQGIMDYATGVIEQLSPYVHVTP